MLTFCEREEIAGGLTAGDTLRSFARKNDGAPSTTRQEVMPELMPSCPTLHRPVAEIVALV